MQQFQRGEHAKGVGVGEVALVFFQGHVWLKLNRQDTENAKDWMLLDYRLFFEGVVFKNSARVSGIP
jgi:hypothetical protein